MAIRNVKSVFIQFKIGVVTSQCCFANYSPVVESSSDDLRLYGVRGLYILCLSSKAPPCSIISHNFLLCVSSRYNLCFCCTDYMLSLLLILTLSTCYSYLLQRQKYYSIYVCLYPRTLLYFQDYAILINVDFLYRLYFSLFFKLKYEYCVALFVQQCTTSTLLLG